MEERKHHHKDTASCEDLGSLVDLFVHAYCRRVAGGRRGREKFMRQIRENPGITQRELAEALGIQSASVSELLIKLEQSGRIRREKDDTDRRMIRIFPVESDTVAPEPAREDLFQALPLLGARLDEWLDSQF